MKNRKEGEEKPFKSIHSAGEKRERVCPAGHREALVNPRGTTSREKIVEDRLGGGGGGSDTRPEEKKRNPLGGKQLLPLRRVSFIGRGKKKEPLPYTAQGGGCSSYEKPIL